MGLNPIYVIIAAICYAGTVIIDIVDVRLNGLALGVWIMGVIIFAAGLADERLTSENTTKGDLK